MISRKRTALATMLLVLVVGQPLLAQGGGDRGRGQRGAAGPSLAPTPKSPAERDAFQAVQTAANGNPNQVITLTDTFMTTYPDSQLTGYVLRLRMEAYERLNKAKEASDAGEKALAAENKFLDDQTKKIEDDAAAAKGKKVDKNAPPPIDKNSPAYKALVDQTQKNRLYYYEKLTTFSLDMQDTAKMLSWGQMALKQEPDDLQTLLMLSSTLARHTASDPKDQASQLKEAEEWGSKGLKLLSDRLNSPMGASMNPAQKAGLLSDAHDTMALVYIKTNRYNEVQKEANLALAQKKDDAMAYYELGVAYINDKPQKVDEAMEAFAKSVFIGGDSKDIATDGLKQIYEQKNKSLVGMDDYVKKAGAKINP
jgi:tetratricopeptide (TPR) repeat protein